MKKVNYFERKVTKMTTATTTEEKIHDRHYESVINPVTPGSLLYPGTPYPVLFTGETLGLGSIPTSLWHVVVERGGHRDKMRIWRDKRQHTEWQTHTCPGTPCFPT